MLDWPQLAQRIEASTRTTEKSRLLAGALRQASVEELGPLCRVLGAVPSALGGDLDRIEEVVYLRGYVNVAPGFTEVAQAVNGASDLMVEIFGEAGAHARTAIGVAMMPYGAALEVEAQVLIR